MNQNSKGQKCIKEGDESKKNQRRRSIKEEEREKYSQ